MFKEGFQNNIIKETQTDIEHHFEVRQHREGVTLYIFKDLAKQNLIKLESNND